ncbi:MAG: glycosyltransferase family 4 protein [Anaerolineae bacterium]|nr:glycosyltransferase family 4 protein [Anaerolineae bacterium]
MKIAFVNQPMGIVMPSEGPVGSVGIVLHELATSLAARSHDVRVYCRARDERRNVRVEHAGGVEFRGIPVLFDQWFTNKAALKIYRNQRRAEKVLGLLRPDHPFFAHRLFHWPYARRLAADMAAETQVFRPDIVHIAMFFQAIPHIRARNPQAKIVLHVYGEELARLDPKPVERYLRGADLILCASDYIKRGMQANFPRLADRCQTSYNGVNVSQFAAVAEHNAAASPPETKRLLYVARVSPEKGVHTLLDAFARIAAGHPNARLEIIGSPQPVPHDRLAALVGPEHMAEMLTFYRDTRGYQQHLQDKVTDDIAHQVTFTGFLPHEEVPDRLRDAYVLIQPSFSDAFPVSVLEGMACRLPIIGTRVGGIPESVEDGETGLLVDAGDVDGLAGALAALLDDPARHAAMAQASYRRVVEVFDWQPVVDTMEQYYGQLLNG